jgi:CO/xanthine dehydrogenase Mo-binding subunit
MTETQINRRDFLKVLGTAGASLVIGIYLNGCDTAEIPEVDATPQTSAGDAESGQISADLNLPEGTLEPDIYIKIDSSGRLTVTAFRSEMGQGVRTAIAMMIADELDMPWENVHIEQAPADPAYGDQVTGGSASISTSNLTVRLAGSSARLMLVRAAAQHWKVNPEDCTTEAGFVVHPDGEQKLYYGDLAGLASEQEIPQMGEAPIKSDDQFRLIGTGVHHWDAPDIITGKAIYGFDVKLPDMSYAAIARCPVFGGSVASFDASKAEGVEGVQQVFESDGKVVVVADNTWAAIKGRQALEIEWDQGGQPDLDSASIRDELAQRAPQLGSAAAGEIEAIYEMPYEAHMTMEPMNCTADLRADRCEVWAPTQNPQSVKDTVQAITKLGREAVTVHVTLMGGGFGRRLQTDYAAEAVKVSREIGGPVHAR